MCIGIKRNRLCFLLEDKQDLIHNKKRECCCMLMLILCVLKEITTTANSYCFQIVLTWKTTCERLTSKRLFKQMWFTAINFKTLPTCSYNSKNNSNNNSKFPLPQKKKIKINKYSWYIHKVNTVNRFVGGIGGRKRGNYCVYVCLRENAEWRHLYNDTFRN